MTTLALGSKNFQQGEVFISSFFFFLFFSPTLLPLSIFYSSSTFNTLLQRSFRQVVQQYAKEDDLKKLLEMIDVTEKSNLGTKRNQSQSPELKVVRNNGSREIVTSQLSPIKKGDEAVLTKQRQKQTTKKGFKSNANDKGMGCQIVSTAEFPTLASSSPTIPAAINRSLRVHNMTLTHLVDEERRASAALKRLKKEKEKTVLEIKKKKRQALALLVYSSPEKERISRNKSKCAKSKCTNQLKGSSGSDEVKRHAVYSNSSRKNLSSRSSSLFTPTIASNASRWVG